MKWEETRLMTKEEGEKFPINKNKKAFDMLGEALFFTMLGALVAFICIFGQSLLNDFIGWVG